MELLIVANIDIMEIIPYEKHIEQQLHVMVGLMEDAGDALQLLTYTTPKALQQRAVAQSAIPCNGTSLALIEKTYFPKTF